MPTLARSDSSATVGRSKPISGGGVTRSPSTWTSTISTAPPPTGHPCVGSFSRQREIGKISGAVLAGFIEAEQEEFAAAWVVIPIRMPEPLNARTAPW